MENVRKYRTGQIAFEKYTIFIRLTHGGNYSGRGNQILTGIFTDKGTTSGRCDCREMRKVVRSRSEHYVIRLPERPFKKKGWTF